MTGASTTRMRPACTAGAWVSAFALAGIFAAGTCALAAAPGARSDGKANSAEKADTSGKAAEQSIDAAVAAMEGGKAEAAAQQLSTLISGGKLPTAQMARALYHRGVAYRKLGKPAQAIADLTSALWIKNGLDAGQRNDALMQRAGAYREAGLPDQAEADEKRVAAAASASPKSASRPQTQAEATRQPDGSGEAASGGIGSFFGAFFGGGSSQPPPSPPAPGGGTPQATAWTTQASKSPPPAAAAGWASSTQVHKSGASRTAASSSWTTGSTGAAPAAAPQAQVVRTAATGRHHVQVAAVRSRGEAEAIAAKLRHIDAPEVKGRQAQIEETLAGNMGTLYRVRLGPFADAGEMRSACSRLRDAGLDCLIVDH